MFEHLCHKQQMQNTMTNGTITENDKDCLQHSHVMAPLFTGSHTYIC